MVQRAIELSMLEAAQLFNGKPPQEWSPEELAAFRARLEKSPSLIGVVGGQQKIDRRLAEVEAALAKAKEVPVLDVVANNKAGSSRKPIRIRRLLEAAVFVVLLGTASYWLYHQLRDMSATPNADRSKIVKNEADAAQKNDPKTGKPKADKKTQSAAPDAPAESDLWRGWKLESTAPGRWNRKMEWDLTNAATPKPVESLTFEDGTVRMKQRRKLADTERWLEIRAKPQPKENKAERIVVRVNGEQTDEIKIGTGEVRWPAFVSLEKFAGQQVDLEVVYEAGGPGQRIAWRSIEFVPQKRAIAKRINCGGPAIESPDGDWEPDDNRTHPYLTSTGTRTFSIKEPAPGPEELQQVYQDERWANQYIEYSVAVEPGVYEVVLHFAETNRGFQAAKKRQFDIIINSLTVAEKFDIFTAAGGSGPFPYRQRVEVKEGPLVIRLQGHPTGPAIKGIEILKLMEGKK